MSKARRDYLRLVEGASVHTLELEVPEDLMDRVLALARRYGWDEDCGEDAPLVVFYHGLAALELEHATAGLDTSDLPAVERQATRLRSRRMWLDGQYAVLRFHLYELMKNNQIMSFRENALRNDNEGLRYRLELFQHDRLELERRLAAGPNQVAAASGQVEETVGPTGASGGIFGRLRSVVRGVRSLVSGVGSHL